MKTTTLKEHSDLESIAGSSSGRPQQAIRLLEKQGYLIIEPDDMRKMSETFEVGRKRDADAYRRFISNRASYDHQ